MKVTLDHIQSIATRKLTKAQIANANSVLTALDKAGESLGLVHPHRLAQFFAQLFHESAEFKYDRELWGPTVAQKRYEGRKDLGNTQKGDGSKFRGRTAIQITGRANTREFMKWCQARFPDVPDFLASPDLLNTDPWEGLGPLWYWDTRKLNGPADQGDIEMVTKKINGGLNGYDDRLRYYARAALVFLGLSPDKGGVEAFQRQAKLPVDGICGPKTRSALHRAMVRADPIAEIGGKIKSAPVTEKEAVAPDQIDKPVTKTTGFWERIIQIIGSGAMGTLAFLGDWRVIIALAGVLIVLSILGLWQHKRIVDCVKALKAEFTT